MRILRILSLAFIGLGLGLSSAAAQTPEVTAAPLPPTVEWQSFDDAIIAAQSAGKHIMVDVYTDWCGWCKKLDRETYMDVNVREVLADSYVSSKVKGDSNKRVKVTSQALEEKGKTLIKFLPTDGPGISERDLTRSQWRVTGYPTILFFSSEGKLITKLPGYYNARAFLNILNFIKDDLYEVMSYQDYIKSLQEAEKQADEEGS